MSISDTIGNPSIRIAEGTLPQKQGDGGYKEMRGDGYGDQYVTTNGLNRRALEGSMFSIRNATALTGVAQTANTTSDTTKPFIFMLNPAGSGKVAILHWLKLKPTAVSSGQTTQNIDIVLSVLPSRTSAGTDYSSKASGIATAGYQQGRADLSVASVLSAIWVGAPVTVLGSDSRNVARFQPRATTIPVAQDRYDMYFGDDAGGRSVGNAVTPVSTTVNQYVEHFMPVLFGPGTGMMVIPWAASIGGAMSWEFEMVWSER